MGCGSGRRCRLAVAAEACAVDLADSRYRAGLDSFLAVLDAQRTLRDGEERLPHAGKLEPLGRHAFARDALAPDHHCARDRIVGLVKLVDRDEQRERGIAP